MEKHREALIISNCHDSQALVLLQPELQACQVGRAFRDRGTLALDDETEEQRQGEVCGSGATCILAVVYHLPPCGIILVLEVLWIRVYTRKLFRTNMEATRSSDGGFLEPTTMQWNTAVILAAQVVMCCAADLVLADVAI